MPNIGRKLAAKPGDLGHLSVYLLFEAVDLGGEQGFELLPLGILPRPLRSVLPIPADPEEA